MKLGILTKVRILVEGITFIPHWLLYLVSPNKRLIDSDIIAWAKYRDFVNTRHLSRSLFILLVMQPEYRYQLAWRLNFLAHFLPWHRGGI